MKKRIINLFALIILIISLFTGCVTNNDNEVPTQSEDQAEEQQEQDNTEAEQDTDSEQNDEPIIVEDGKYTTPEEVSLYIHTFNKLPSNFITKKKAMDLGWDSNKGNLWDVTEQMSIGGDTFGNREGLLPKKDGRKWIECDINYEGGFRGAERIVFSNDGLIYYTNDHYETFTKLY